MSMPMPVIALSSSSKTNISHPSEISQNKSSTSHIDETEDTFVLKLGNNTNNNAQSLTASSISIPHDHHHHHLIFPGKNQIKVDSEIDVFNAEKYFNEAISPKLVPKILPPHQPRNSDPLEIFPIREKSQMGTPSIISESLSNNSRTVLLHNVPRIPPKPKKKSFFLERIGCKPSCCYKYYADINDDASKSLGTLISTDDGFIKGRSRRIDFKGGDDHQLVRKLSNSDFSRLKFEENELRVNSNGHFSFPVCNTCSNDQATKKQVYAETVTPKRRSLQVFGSPVMEISKKCCSPEKNPNALTWDAIPKALQEIKIPSNESDSDDSSDLFEIESFSKGNPFLSRQASDNGTTCYAPSETSIEWSVVTASAVDYSVPSDSEELKSNQTGKMLRDNNEKGLNSKVRSIDESSTKRRSLSILSGCKNHKAVQVVGDAQKANNNEKGFANSTRRCNRTESLTQMTRFYDETKVSEYDARNRQRSFGA